MRKQLVVAHYNEPLDWLGAMPADWEILVYHKGSDPLPESPRYTVLPVPNKGREGETFLRHVRDHYADLADYTAFLQGNPFDHLSLAQLQDALAAPSQTAFLGNWLECDAYGFPHHPLHWPLPIEGVAKSMGLTPAYPLGFCAGAQWIVTRKDIQRHPAAYYADARRVLLLNTDNGYVLERLWPAIWGYTRPTQPVGEVWGLLYTHHNVPDRVLQASLASVQAMGLPWERVVICGHRPDKRFPPAATLVYHDTTELCKQHWAPAIYEQMEQGALRVPDGARIACLEHDILYPACYLDTVSELAVRPDLTYFWAHIRHLDLRPSATAHFWDTDPNGTHTFQSGAVSSKSLLLLNVGKKLAKWHHDRNPGAFEPGTEGPWETMTHLAGQALPPLIDIRHGRNASRVGDDQPMAHTDAYLPAWGMARHWQNRLLQP